MTNKNIQKYVKKKKINNNHRTLRFGIFIIAFVETLNF